MSASPSLWSRVASLATSPLLPSHYLELVAPLRATHTRHSRIMAISEETPTARTLTIRPGHGWRTHRAGQYVRVSAAVQGRLLSRTYSISSAPERADGCITITVQAIAGGRMSGFLARDAAPGDYLTLGLPEGDFGLPDPTPIGLLFVTAGSGVTPIASMIRSLAAREQLGDVVHLHYAPDERSAIFAAELTALATLHPGYRFVLRTTRQGAAHLSTEQLDALCPDWRTRQAWACGPEGLLGAAEAAFAGCGERLHVERFRPRLAPACPGAQGGRVRFGKSRLDVEAAGDAPLLQVAERAGVSAPHGCRMGICHSCDATLVSGAVRDLRTGCRIDEPGARVQVCVCAALGDLELAL